MSGSSCFVNSCIINHFGMKPVSGGRPPRESKMRAATVVRVGVFVQASVRVLIFVVIIVLNVRKAAAVMMMYVPRERRVNWGANWRIMIIQPRWAIDE